MASEPLRTPPLAFHHVGVVTRDLRGTSLLYGMLGYAPSATFDDPIQKVSIILMRRDDGPMIELVSPSHPSSPSMGWVKRIQAGPYHTCYETPDLGDAIAWWKEQRVNPLTDPVPAVAFGGRRIVFLWGDRFGLVEMLEAAAP